MNMWGKVSNGDNVFLINTWLVYGIVGRWRVIQYE